MEQTTQCSKNICPIIVAVLITAIIVGGGVYLWQGQKTQISPEEASSEEEQTSPLFADLSACGDFPEFSGTRDVGARYFVCRDFYTGECYYKTSYPELIEGCDPEFEKNPYGRIECFINFLDVYDFNGDLTLKKVSTAYNPEDTCRSTTQIYFESKVKE